MNATQAIAAAFSAIVRAELSGYMPEIIAKNAAYGDACATHDYCDANMLMADAFEIAMGRSANIQNQTDLDLINAAWGAAKQSDFAL
jgi:hypothetical protein